MSSILNDIIKFSIFNGVKTNNPVLDAILTTGIISALTYVTSMTFDVWSYMNPDFDFTKRLFYRRNAVILEGQQFFVCSSHDTSITSAYGDRFKSLWYYIINTIEANKTIYEVTESTSFKECSYQTKSENSFMNNLFIVTQNKKFLIDKELDIYAVANFKKDDYVNKEKKSETQVNKISIELFSYSSTIGEIKDFLDKITVNYLESIENGRFNKKYIYTLTPLNKKNNDDYITKFDNWSETLFETTRSFDNIFFDKKEEVRKKVDFFLENKDWYYEKGVPYTLGIGLHGPPGTGKTSFIKSLANYTGRNIVNVSFKSIKTKRDLDGYFFEDQYSGNNKSGSVCFDKKIIVFEDIDCIGDIVLSRKYKHSNKHSNSKSKKEKILGNANIKDVVDTIMENVDIENKKTGILFAKEDDAITLDDILNLWDGIRETPGRILVITSNHYHKLDTALIRPGRIDITLEMSYASHKTINDIFYHFMEERMDDELLVKIKPHFYTPAEITNIILSFMKNDLIDSDACVERLLLNKHV